MSFPAPRRDHNDQRLGRYEGGGYYTEDLCGEGVTLVTFREAEKVSTIKNVKSSFNRRCDCEYPEKWLTSQSYKDFNDT